MKKKFLAVLLVGSLFSNNFTSLLANDTSVEGVEELAVLNDHTLTMNVGEKGWS